jgi:hypothetical protein
MVKMGKLRTVFSNFSEIMAIVGFAEEGEFDTARKMLEEISQINFVTRQS